MLCIGHCGCLLGDDDGIDQEVHFNVPDNFNFTEGMDSWIILSDANGKSSWFAQT